MSVFLLCDVAADELESGFGLEECDTVADVVWGLPLSVDWAESMGMVA